MKTDSGATLKSRAIQAAVLLVRKHGYEKFRLSDVAKELNVSHAALYRHFTNKEELLDAIHLEWLLKVNETLSSIASSTDKTAQTRIKKWFVKLYEMKRRKALDDSQPYASFTAAAKQKKPFIINHIQMQYEQLYSMVAEAFPTQDTGELSRILWEATTSYHHPQLVWNDAKNDNSKILESLLDLLLEGVK